MNNASLELGGTNWAEKEGSLLGYAVNDTNNKYSAKEFTFGRGTNLSATRIGKTGLIEKGRENVLLQSNQFDTTWSKIGSSVTSGQSGYDGSNDAWLLQALTTTGASIRQSVSKSGVQAYSVYAKAGTANYLGFYNIAGLIPRAWFDLSNGSVGTTLNNIDAKIESVGNGWYKCSLIYDQVLSEVRIYAAASDNTFATSVGDNIYIQDAQLEQGLAASPYIPTTTTTAQAGVLENTPRLNYTTGVANPYLLLEPSRTNLLPYSEFFDPWNTDSGEVKTANTIQSPEGLVNGNTLRQNNAASQLNVYKVTSVTSGADYSFSVWLKKKSTNQVQIYQYSTAIPVGFLSRATIDFDAGTITDVEGSGATIEPYQNGWFRCSIKCASTSTSLSNGIYTATAGQADVYVYGAQAEQGSYPTSYIPTYSVSATRAADSCSKTNASDVIGQTEGTIFGEFTFTANFPTMHMFASVAGSFANAVYVQTFSATGISMQVWSGVVNQVGINSSGLSIGQNVKFAAAYKNNDFVFYVNGAQVGTDTSGSVPSGLSQLEVGGYAEAGSPFNYNTPMKQATLFKERLTNAELATLTTI